MNISKNTIYKVKIKKKHEQTQKKESCAFYILYILFCAD